MRNSLIHRAAPWIFSALALSWAIWIVVKPAHEAEIRGATTESRTLRLAAAASLGDVMGEAVARWNEITGDEVEVVTGASSTLARQIQNGAPYDVFVSANSVWMDALVADERVDPADVAVIAENRLVVVTRLARGEREGDRARPWEPMLFESTSEAGPRWALGDPEHVPAGMYAKEALTALGVWDSLRSRVVPASDVRAALRLVARGEVEFGIVYRTDVVSGDRVAVVTEVPAMSHARASVVVGRIRHSQEGAALLATWLSGPTVAGLLEAHGFRVEVQ